MPPQFYVRGMIPESPVLHQHSFPEQRGQLVSKVTDSLREMFGKDLDAKWDLSSA